MTGVQTCALPISNSACLRSFAHCQAPPLVLNLSGPEKLSVRDIANAFGERFSITPVFQAHESGEALLSNSSKAHALFGKPTVSPERIMDWIAHWITGGGAVLGKPTHFEVRDGKF